MSHRSYSQLLEITGNANPRLLFCPVCMDQMAIKAEPISCPSWHHWAIRLHCADDSHPPWVVCKHCPRMNRPLSDNSNSLRNHLSRYHKQHSHKRRKKQASSIDFPSGSPLSEDRTSSLGDFFVEFDLSPGDTNSNLCSISTESNTCSYSRSQSSKFFNALSLHNGSSYLVGLSQFGFAIPKNETDPEEVLLHVKIANFASKLSTTQCREFTDLLYLLHQFYQKKRSTWSTTIPLTPNLLYAQSLKGRNSIVTNLPYPEIKVLDDHAYVSIKDCIADILGFGFPLDSPVTSRAECMPVEHLSQSAHANKILLNALKAYPDDPDVKVIWFNEWADDFEANNSPKSRSSIWLKTITFSPPPSLISDNQAKRLNYTYPIAIGPKCSNHNNVEKLFANELKDLRAGRSSCNQFYDFQQKRLVNVYAELFVSLGDQPERRGANYVMLGNSQFSARWGLAMDLAAVASGIPTCASCLSDSVQQQAVPLRNTCSHCCKWEMECSSGILDFDPPQDYPKDMIPPSQKLRPLKVSFEVMKNAVALAHDKVVQSEWSSREALSYLRVHGINQEATDEILLHAENALAFRITSVNVEDQLLHQELLSDKLSLPHLFERWEYPAFWDRGVDVRQHVEAVMHLMFLGVTKTMVKSIKKWLICKNLNAQFLKIINNLMDDVMELNLSWVNLQPYLEGKLGTWVSENYLGFARISPWFYSSSLPLLQIPPPHTDPSTLQKNWTKKQNLSWLRARQLDTKGNARTLRQRVASFLLGPEPIPPIIPPIGADLSDVLKLVHAHHHMVSTLMVNKVTIECIQIAENAIKVFLDKFELHDSALRKSEDKPTWVTSYNFVCLLNLPYMMQEYGPLRNLWEGSLQGEGFIKQVKPKIKKGLRKNWQKNTLQAVFEQMALERLNQATQEETNLDHSSNVNNMERYSNLHMYQNHCTCINRFYRRKPLSVVLLNNGKLHLVIKKNHDNEEQTYFIGVEMQHNSFVTTHHGLHYHHYKICSDTEEDTTMFECKEIEKTLLFLPLISHGEVLPMTDQNMEGIYTSFDMDWNSITTNHVRYAKPNFDPVVPYI